jgi:hypothetical protein
VVPVCSEFLGVHSLGFVRHEETALLFPVADTATAARHVQRLAEDAGLLEELSRAGRARAETFTMEWSRRRWLNAFQETLALPVRGLGELSSDDLLVQTGRGSRLERLGLSPGVADWLRRRLGRMPRFADGWGEWPGTVSAPDDATRTAMLAELRRLDRPQPRALELTPHAS